MSDGTDRLATWAEYLRARTGQPGWSVAKLARESGVHRATIFKWLAGKGGVTVTSVRAIAIALGDDPEAVLRAATGHLVKRGEAEDPDLDEIRTSGLSQAAQDALIEQLTIWRQQDAQRRSDDIRRMIRLAKGEIA